MGNAGLNIFTERDAVGVLPLTCNVARLAVTRSSTAEMAPPFP
eukprot:CAMPEP_0203995112 /NCGR_PEP_ID=MMETSP0360-20130528/11859_1 /ASSEMBLY_ACC=CAM_ASM_000342 /TAXON_ID=268821 /ORGANISM="Scrippsiella Hangoei, Strain SHTV-5" /LENGTH=42 /DNA_ID= /DNA_START= /DNA_END= /DNA_ORIENTATION=